jgi:hypothetical protein
MYFSLFVLRLVGLHLMNRTSSSAPQETDVVNDSAIFENECSFTNSKY